MDLLMNWRKGQSCHMGRIMMIMRLCGILLLLVLLGIATATEEDLLELPELLQGQWRGQFVDHVSGTTYPVYLNFSTIMLDSEEEDSGILHTSVLKREESEPPMYRRIGEWFVQQTGPLSGTILTREIQSSELVTKPTEDYLLPRGNIGVAKEWFDFSLDPVGKTLLTSSGRVSSAFEGSNGNVNGEDSKFLFNMAIRHAGDKKSGGKNREKDRIILSVLNTSGTTVMTYSVTHKQTKGDSFIRRHRWLLLGALWISAMVIKVFYRRQVQDDPEASTRHASAKRFLEESQSGTETETQEKNPELKKDK